MTSTGRPAEAVAAQRRSSPREARRSTSVVTPATASASRPTSAVSPGSSRRRGRVPRTGHSPDFRGLFQAFTQLGPIARCVEDLGLILPIIAGPDGIDPHVVPGGPAAIHRRSGLSGLRVALFADNGVRTPTPTIGRCVRGRGACARGRGRTRRGAPAARTGRGRGCVGQSMISRRRPRLADAPDQRGRDARARLLRQREAGSSSTDGLPGRCA